MKKRVWIKVSSYALKDTIEALVNCGVENIAISKEDWSLVVGFDL